jgi:hypothetical protein
MPASDLWHSWLRIQRLLRTMLKTEWSSEAWPRVKRELWTALKERARLERQGWFKLSARPRTRLLIVALALFAAPFAVEAQRAGRTPRVGVLYFNTLQGAYRCDVGFRQGLAELGYVEGKSVFLEVRSAEGKADRLRELAAELVRLKVDVIFAPGTVVAQSVKQAKGTMPIVFASAADPIGSGLIEGFGRPGGILPDCPSLLALRSPASISSC